MKAVIMAGGQGTRFWPLSRRRLPKQFLSIAGTATMLQETVCRLKPAFSTEDIYVACSPEYVTQVRAQLPELPEEQLVVEPLARNTAACIGLSAITLRRRFPEEIMAVLPADHVIRDAAEFHRRLKQAAELARQNWLVTFGIQPDYPATGYGYLERGEKINLEGGGIAYEVAAFTEKPDFRRAGTFVESGRFYWNSGMFVWSVSAILDRIRTFMPPLYQGLLEIERSGYQDDVKQRVFESLDKISIDYGVMERAERVALLPCNLGWSDVGGWQAVADLREQDAEGISSNAPLVALESRDCLVHLTSGKLVALLGVEDLVVVDTPDALLICRKDRAEQIRRMVEELERRGWDEYL